MAGSGIAGDGVRGFRDRAPHVILVRDNTQSESRPEHFRVFFVADCVTSHEASVVPPSNVSECPAPATRVISMESSGCIKVMHS